MCATASVYSIHSEAGSSPLASRVLDCSHNAPGTYLSRLIQDGHGNSMFIGDSANISFLQVIRTLVSNSLGSHLFAGDSFWNLAVGTTPVTRSDWTQEMANQPPPRPTRDEARYLINWYCYAVNSVLRLYDERDFNRMLFQWPQMNQNEPQQRATSMILFLVFAIGAQTCPEDRDEEAERYFNYGRFLAMSGMTGDPDLASVQAHILITLYLLGASQKNVAFVYLGTAVRAAYAIGLHRREVNALFDLSEFTLREKVWKVLRILDLFTCALLGRPPSTHETRNTAAKENYSTSNDICLIFERVLTDVYTERNISDSILERISEHHRQWADRFPSSLAFDGIYPSPFTEVGGQNVPNIGLIHIKEGYYWTIMLLTRPYLIQVVSKHLSPVTAKARSDEIPAPESQFHFIAAHACIDSAIRTVELSQSLKSNENIPKRLPLVINSLFLAALVLGLAQFSDLDRQFPIEKGLAGAQEQLGMFSRHDAVARSYLAVVNNLRAAGAFYFRTRARHRMERQGQLIRGLFGAVHGDRTASPCPMTVEDGVQGMAGGSSLSELYPTPVPGTQSSCRLDNDNDDFLRSTRSKTQPVIDPSAASFLSDFAPVTDLAFPMTPRTVMYDPHIFHFSNEDASQFNIRQSL